MRAGSEFFFGGGKVREKKFLSFIIRNGFLLKREFNDSSMA